MPARGRGGRRELELQNGGPRKRPRRAPSQVHDFVEWAVLHGAILDGAEIRERDGVSDRGIFSVRPLPQGHVVAILPRHMVISVNVARASAIGQAILTVKPETSGRTLLYAFLLHEKFLAGTDSFWHPYFRHLPDQYHDPLWWHPRVRHVLRGTNLGAELPMYIAKLRTVFDALFPSPMCEVNPQLFPRAVFTWKNWLWARSTFTSRAFPDRFPDHIGDAIRDHCSTTTYGVSADLLKGDDDGCLLPVIDASNHRHRAAVTWHYDRDGVRFQLDAPCRAGEEIFNNYGGKTNEEFLLGYGFVLDENPEDAVFLKLGARASPECDTSIATKIQLLSASGLEKTHFLYASKLPITLLAAMRILVANERELPLLIDRVRTPSDTGPTTLLCDANEGHVLHALITLLEQKLHEMGPPGTESGRVGASSVSVRHRAMGARYRDGQRQILASSIERAYARQRGLRLQRLQNSWSPTDSASLFHASKRDAQAEHRDLLWTQCLLRNQIDPYHIVSSWSISNGWRAICATDLPAETELLRIPISLIPSAASIVESECPLGEMLRSVEGLDAETVLTLYLLSCTTRKGGVGIMQANLMNSLISSTGNAAAVWSDEELALLNCDDFDPIVSHVRDLRGYWRDLYDQLIPPLQSQYEDELRPQDCTWDKFLWASIAARGMGMNVRVPPEQNGGVDISSHPVDSLRLLPFPAIARVHPHAPVHVRWDDEHRSFGLYTLIDLKAGDEVVVEGSNLNHSPGRSPSMDEILTIYGVVVHGDSEAVIVSVAEVAAEQAHSRAAAALSVKSGDYDLKRKAEAALEQAGLAITYELTAVGVPSKVAEAMHVAYRALCTDTQQMQTSIALAAHLRKRAARLNASTPTFPKHMSSTRQSLVSARRSAKARILEAIASVAEQ